MKITRLCGVRLRLVSRTELLCKFLSGFQKVCNYSSCNYHYHGITVHTAQLLKYILIICSTCLLVIISQRLELSEYCRPQGNNNLYPPPPVLAAKYGVAGPVLCWSMAHTVNITDSKGDVLPTWEQTLPPPLYILVCSKYWDWVWSLSLLPNMRLWSEAALSWLQLSGGCKDQFYYGQASSWGT